MNVSGYVLEMGIVFYVIDPRPFFEDPEIIAERKINRTGSDLRFVERFDGDRFIF
jgi:hypothetical protein